MHSWICVSGKNTPSITTLKRAGIFAKSPQDSSVLSNKASPGPWHWQRETVLPSQHTLFPDTIDKQPVPWSVVAFEQPTPGSLFLQSDCAVSIERARKGENISVVHESNYGNGCQNVEQQVAADNYQEKAHADSVSYSSWTEKSPNVSSWGFKFSCCTWCAMLTFKQRQWKDIEIGQQKFTHWFYFFLIDFSQKPF